MPADAPIPGEVEAKARGGRAETKADMRMNEAGREARRSVAREDAREGRAGVAAETEKPFEHHATENVPVVGEWLAGKLFGTAGNEAPDGGGQEAPGGGDGAAPGGDDRPRASQADRKRWRHGR